MLSFSTRQLLRIALFFTGNACLAAFELKTDYIGKMYGPYAHAALLTCCFAASVLAVGLTYFYNYFSTEFAREDAAATQRARYDALKALAADETLWKNIGKTLNKTAACTAAITCRATVVYVAQDNEKKLRHGVADEIRESNFELALSVTYAVGQYQIGYDDLPCKDVSACTVETLSDAIMDRYYKLYEYSGLRIGLERYKKLLK